MIPQVRPIDLQYTVDSRGGLVVAEEAQHVPFEVRRVYALVDVPEGMSRGRHAHRELQQVFLVLHGALTLTVDNGWDRDVIRLASPGQGLYVGPMVWRELDAFAPSTVCVVLASMRYDENDYIRDYDVFQSAVRASTVMP